MKAKNHVILLLVLALAAVVTTPVEARKASNKSLPVILDALPSFNGDNTFDTFNRWIKERIASPKFEKASAELTFVIDKRGEMSSITIVESTDSLLADSLTSLLCSSPAWSPALLGVDSVAVGYRLRYKVNDCLTEYIYDLDGMVYDPANPPMPIRREQPKFRGSSPFTFGDWMAKNLRYPAESYARGTRGVVMLRFIVRYNGSIDDVRIIQSPDEYMAYEVRQVVNKCPPKYWTPGKLNGKPSNVTLYIPVVFE